MVPSKIQMKKLISALEIIYHRPLDNVFLKFTETNVLMIQAHRADHLIHIYCQCEDSLTPLVSPSCQFIASHTVAVVVFIDLKPV